MPTIDIAYRIDPFPSEEELQPMWQAAWGSPWSGDLAFILTRSLTHACAYAGDRVIGYVNVAWDGGVHAFVLDTTVDPEFQRRGIARELVRLVTAEAKTRGAHWLHVDYEPHLNSFYESCGFRPTAAGLIDLTKLA
jgi:ribosomal protein S18 acetylase RimI-like enzyme